jgi:DNA-binding LacI/PurR family transcriptional regulator
VTLATLARELGVSKTTVSNAFNHPDQLSPALRAQVLDTARRLGYAGPDPVAATLSRGRVGAIGLLFFDDPLYPLHFAFSDPAHVLFLEGVADACGRAGVGLVLVGGGSSVDLVRAALVDGFICQHDVTGDERLEAVVERGLPMVVVDGPARPGAGHVGVDDRGGAAAAARHLLELGHSRVAYLNGAGMTRLDTRRETLRGAVEAAGSKFTEVLAPNMTIAGGEIGAQELLALPELPTALVCANDLIALGVLRVLERNGLRVPDDLALVGFDDVDFARSLSVPLTTVRQDKYLLGQQAADLLLRELRDEDHEHAEVLLASELVVRASTVGRG